MKERILKTNNLSVNTYVSKLNKVEKSYLILFF